MNKSANFLWLIILTLICIISSTAQNNIAFVNKHYFTDEKTGIKELVEANKQLDKEFETIGKELKTFYEYYQKQLNDIKTLTNSYPSSCFPTLVEKKIAENEKLGKDLKIKTDTAKTLYEKRKAEFIIPINKQIGEKLKEFAKLKKYEKIFDLSETELEDSDLLYTNDPIDVTEEFIKFCNEEFAKEKIQKQ